MARTKAQREKALLIRSNTGGAPLTKGERKALAERMYKNGNGLTMQVIADMLCVSKGDDEGYYDD